MYTLEASPETYFNASRSTSPSHCGSPEHSVQLQTLQELPSHSQSMVPTTVDVPDQIPAREEEEEESECMDISEMKRGIQDDTRMHTADPGVDIVPLQVGSTESLLQVTEWLSMEEMPCRVKGSEIGMSSDDPLQECTVLSPSSDAESVELDSTAEDIDGAGDWRKIRTSNTKRVCAIYSVAAGLLTPPRRIIKKGTLKMEQKVKGK